MLIKAASLRKPCSEGLLHQGFLAKAFLIGTINNASSIRPPQQGLLRKASFTRPTKEAQRGGTTHEAYQEGFMQKASLRRTPD
jgi:hypothetical protein